jgi:hypothetical protein
MLRKSFYFCRRMAGNSLTLPVDRASGRTMLNDAKWASLSVLESVLTTEKMMRDETAAAVLLVPAAGVEPATFRSGGERSNPLSYAGLNKMACFKEMNQECPPFCPPFLTVFVPLVKYRAALVSSQD